MIGLSGTEFIVGEHCGMEWCLMYFCGNILIGLLP